MFIAGVGLLGDDAGLAEAVTSLEALHPLDVGIEHRRGAGGGVQIAGDHQALAERDDSRTARPDLQRRAVDRLPAAGRDDLLVALDGGFGGVDGFGRKQGAGARNGEARVRIVSLRHSACRNHLRAASARWKRRARRTGRRVKRRWQRPRVKLGRIRAGHLDIPEPWGRTRRAAQKRAAWVRIGGFSRFWRVLPRTNPVMFRVKEREHAGDFGRPSHLQQSGTMTPPVWRK